MTAEEKSELFTFLHISHNWLSGCRTELPMPVFVDSNDTIQNPIQVLVIADKPFTHEEKVLLDKMLGAIKLADSVNCALAYISNESPHQNRETSAEAPQEKSPAITMAIEENGPMILLSAGKTACQYLLHTKDDLTSLRCRSFEVYGIPLIATYHPRDLIQDETLKRPAWEDLKYLRAELDRIIER